MVRHRTGPDRAEGEERTTPSGAVLLTDAPSNANLAAARSLGRRGVFVGVCEFEGEFNLSSYSRYVRERLVLPSPSRDPGGFVAELAKVLGAGRYSVLFPTTERTMQVVSEGRERLPDAIVVPIPDAEAVETARDKERTLVLARSLGVPTPVTWCPTDPGAVPHLARGLTYPVIVKPRQTNFVAPDDTLRKSSYVVATSERELMAGYERIHAIVPRPLVQTVVSGTGAGIFSIWNHGTPLAWFAHRRLREEDPRGGRASAAVSVPCHPRLVGYATRLLKALRWHGVAMVEFKWDERTDAVWLMEINGRFWGSLALALAAGMDFPYYLYRIATGEPVEGPASYPVGVMARDAVAELKHFVRVMWGPRSAFPASVPSRWETLRQARTMLHPFRASYNWTADDPEPGRREWLKALGRLAGAR